MGIYFIVSYCSFFNIVQIRLQLPLILVLAIMYSDRIKLHSITGIVVLVVIHIFSFLFAKNFNFGFWDPINFIMKYISLFQLFIIYDIFISLDNNKKHLILNVILISISVTNIVSIYYNIGDKFAIRYRPENYIFIMNFSQFYALPILISTLIAKILFQRTASLLLLTTLLSSVVVLIIGNLMTGLILGAFGILLVFLLWLTRANRLKQILTSLLSFLAIMLLRTPMANFIRRITTFRLFSDLQSSKLLVVAKLLEGGEATSTLSVRNDYKKYAINSYKEYPYFGLPYEEYRYGTISGHADWYDLLAMNGFIGFLALLLVLIYLCIRVFKNTKEQANLISFFVALTIFVVLGFLNPSFSVEILLMTFIVSSQITYVA